MGFIETISSYLGKFDTKCSSLENLLTKKKNEQVKTIAGAIFASLYSIGLGTVVLLRFFTRHFSVKEKPTTPTDEKIENVALFSKSPLKQPKTPAPKEPPAPPSPSTAEIPPQLPPNTSNVSPATAEISPQAPSATTETPVQTPPIQPQISSKDFSEEELQAITESVKDIEKDGLEKGCLLVHFFKDFAPFSLTTKNEKNQLTEKAKNNREQLGIFANATSLEDLQKMTTQSTRTKTEEYLKSFPGKTFNDETKRDIFFLIAYLEIHPELNLKLGKADDTGDCFYESIAQQLSLKKKQPFTTKMVRKAISDQINSKSFDKNWLYKRLGNDYKDYTTAIALTFDEINEKQPQKNIIKKELAIIKEQLDKPPPTILLENTQRLLLSKRTSLEKQTQNDLIIENISIINAQLNSITLLTKTRKFLIDETYNLMDAENQIPSAPFWGSMEVDAEIVAKLFNCQVKALSLSSFSLLHNKGQQDPFNTAPENDAKGPILYIAHYGKHFVPLLPTT